ncbi:MAG: LCP family protein [Actinomycetota bacterium]
MIRRVSVAAVVLATWVAGTVAASIGAAVPAGALPTMSIGRAHADYVPVMDGSAPLFILLIGSDARPETATEDGLADSLHVLGINPAEGRATLFGIPRDAYVPIASGGTNKINTAMSAGGIDNQIATIENLTGMTIDYYALTRFEGFSAAATQVGGFTVDVPVAFQGYTGTLFEEGPMQIKGNTALEFARTRKSLSRGDFQRSINQGVAVQGAIATFSDAFDEDPSVLYRWLGAGLRNVQTSLSLDELTDLAMLATTIAPKRITNLVAVGATGSAGSISIVVLSGDNEALWADMAEDGYILAKNIPALARSS